MKNDIKYYSVGALMYTPANNKTIVQNLLRNKFGDKFSLAFCLEDTINDDMIEEAEDDLIVTLNSLYNLVGTQNFYMPKVFIRVRNPEQILKIADNLGNACAIISGFNIPKFTPECADDYFTAIKTAEEVSNCEFYIMPILESPLMVDLRTRIDFLYKCKEKFDSVEEKVLNIRVGGNDLSHTFGLRRHSDETVYDIKPVADILIDILTVFSQDYIVSGAVWEYYNGEHWAEGFRDEIKMDMLSGFIGKTVIHPKQISVLNEASKVLKEDYEDAKSILGWDKSNISFVSGSKNSSRMNEYKTHFNWAEKIMYLAEYYGIK